MKYLSMLACFLFVSTAAASEANVTIVADGKPKAVIVRADDAPPEVGIAASELQKYVEWISGAKLPVRTSPSAASGVPIKLVIDPSLAGVLTEDGYIITVAPDRIELTGATGIAVGYAVYTLLEERMGCRWFFPIKGGEEIPTSKTIALRIGATRYRPSFRFRRIGSTAYNDWNFKNRLSEDLHIGKRSYDKVWGVAHTFWELVPIKKNFDKHPDWYAMINGKRQKLPGPPSHGPNLCTSNPEVVRAVADAINKMFDRYPELVMITLGPNDGLRFCECPNCQAQDEPGREWTGPDKRLEWRGQLTRRMMLFFNAVARLVHEKHPDKIVKIMMYSWYQEPPSDPNLRFEDNICVMLTHSGNPSQYETLFPSCYNHPLTDPACRPNAERFLPALKAWRQRSKHLGIYEYYDKASVCEVLFPIVHTIRKDLPFLRNLGVEYFYTQGAGPDSNVVGLNYYVAAKLLWDADTNVDALLADFYTRYYQDAAEPMRRYHERLEEAMATRAGDVLGYPFYTTRVFDEPLVRELRGYLDAAKEQTKVDRVRERIHVQKVVLDYTLVMRDLCRNIADTYHDLTTGPDAITDRGALANALADRIAPAQQAVRDFIASEPVLSWVKVDKDNYLQHMLNRGIAPFYISLQPTATTKPAAP